jgi:hypothetical protein
MSEATSGFISYAAPHVAVARRKTRVNALMAHAGYMLAARKLARNLVNSAAMFDAVGRDSGHPGTAAGRENQLTPFLSARC